MTLCFPRLQAALRRPALGAALVVGSVIALGLSDVADVSGAEAAGSRGSSAGEPSPAPKSGGTADSGNLSERLNQSSGVIAPPRNVDPHMAVKPPAGTSSGKMQIIPPPGSPGGNPNVAPK